MNHGDIFFIIDVAGLKAGEHRLEGKVECFKV